MPKKKLAANALPEKVRERRPKLKVRRCIWTFWQDFQGAQREKRLTSVSGKTSQYGKEKGTKKHWDYTLDLNT